jgi:hypothetical protein
MSENDFLSLVAVCVTGVTALAMCLRHRARRQTADRNAAKKASTP